MPPRVPVPPEAAPTKRGGSKARCWPWRASSASTSATGVPAAAVM